MGKLKNLPRFYLVFIVILLIIFTAFGFCVETCDPRFIAELSSLAVAVTIGVTAVALALIAAKTWLIITTQQLENTELETLQNEVKENRERLENLVPPHNQVILPTHRDVHKMLMDAIDKTKSSDEKSSINPQLLKLLERHLDYVTAVRATSSETD